MEEGGPSTSGGSRKRPLAFKVTSAAADSKRLRPTAAQGKGPTDGGEDDLDFLLRLQAQEDTGGRGKGAQMRAMVNRLKQTRRDSDDDDDKDEDDEEAARVKAHRQQERGGHDAEEDCQPRDTDIFTAVEFLNFEATQRLLATEPELVGLRHPFDLCLPLAVAIAARFDRGVKLLLSQVEPPCPLLLVDGRGYSALHLAVEAYPDMPFLARFLLQWRGIDINTPAPGAPLADGATPLHVAARSPEDDRALRLLLASGADVSLVDAEGRTALDLVGRWPAGSKARKRARHLLTRRAPFQSYVLHKLRLLAWIARHDEDDKDEEQEGHDGPAAAARAANKAAVAALSRTALQHLLDMRVEAQTQEVGVWADSEEGGDGDDAVLCRLETAGVYSFINATGHLCLARVDRAVSPLLLSSSSPAPTSTSTQGAAATAASSPATSPSSSPITTSTSASSSNSTEAAAAAPALATTAAVSPSLSPACCPLSRLKAVRAAIFDLGEADEETVLSRQNSSGAGQEEQGDREPWVALPPLPTLQIYRREEGDGDGEQVLHFVIHELRDEGVFDALQAMLWR